MLLPSQTEEHSTSTRNGLVWCIRTAKKVSKAGDFLATCSSFHCWIKFFAHFDSPAFCLVCIKPEIFHQKGMIEKKYNSSNTHTHTHTKTIFANPKKFKAQFLQFWRESTSRPILQEQQMISKHAWFVNFLLNEQSQRTWIGFTFLY